MLKAHSEPSCRHAWIVAPARGPVSLGTCQFCHATKEFDNGWYFNPNDTAHLYEPAAEGRATRAGVLGDMVSLGLAARVWSKEVGKGAA